MPFFAPPTVVVAPHWCIPEAPLWLFAVLQSLLFTAWVATVAGRLKSDFRLSPGTVYNPFPFPPPNPELEATGAGILTARGDAPLGRLYRPGAMPQTLEEAHAANDDAVDRAVAGRALAARDERARAALEAWQAMQG